MCTSLTKIIDEQGNIVAENKLPKLSGNPVFLSPTDCLTALRNFESWAAAGNTAIYRKKALLESGGSIKELGAYSDGFIRKVV